MRDSALAYLKGLVLCYFATMIFVSIGWIELDQNLAWNRLGIPLIVGGAIWTILFFASEAIWHLIVILAAFFHIIGVVFGLGCLGYCSLKLGQYVMGPGTLKFTDDDLLLVIMGMTYAIITLVIHPERFNSINTKLKKALH